MNRAVRRARLPPSLRPPARQYLRGARGLAAYEHFLEKNDHGDLDLSEQFLYWARK